MLSNLTIELTTDDVTQIVQSVFSTMMDVDVVQAGPDPGSQAGRLTAALSLTGEWNGGIALEFEPEQACRLTARFLQMDSSDIPEVDDSVRDVLGEIANMIAGNLKSVLAPGGRLSMPSVVEGRDYHMRVCGAVSESHYSFDSSEGRFWMTIVATDAHDTAPVI